MKRLLRALPYGGTLPESAWKMRHRSVLILLWLHVTAVPLFAQERGYGIRQGLLEAGLIAAPALAATVGSNRRWRACAATVAALTSSAVLVHLSGGLIEMHFHFFVMIAMIGLYQDWAPWLLSIVYVVVHRSVLGGLYPRLVYEHEEAWLNPWRWALIHGAFIVVASAISAITWRLNEKTQEGLREAQQRFRNAFDSAPIGMALVGLDGRWLQVNPTLCEMTGYPEEDLLAGGFQDITHPDSLDDELADLRKLIAGDIDSLRREKHLLHTSGHAVPVQLSMTVVRSHVGQPLYCVAQMEDITERRKAEEYYRQLYKGQRALVRELQEAHALKSELFNTVSHEFKTPLAGIIGFAGLLSSKGGQLSEESRDRYLEIIARQGERLNRLVENLFVSGREVEPAEGVVADVEMAMDAARSQLSDTYDDVGLDITIENGLRPLIAQEALRLIVLNLVSNALKHAAPNSHVKVTGAGEDGDVVISVTNAGAPIPENARPRIFEPFARSPHTGRTVEGVGLGLHIVRKLVTAYGGDVGVDCTESTVTFFIRVPDSGPSDLPDGDVVEMMEVGATA